MVGLWLWLAALGKAMIRCRPTERATPLFAAASQFVRFRLRGPVPILHRNLEPIFAPNLSATTCYIREMAYSPLVRLRWQWLPSFHLLQGRNHHWSFGLPLFRAEAPTQESGLLRWFPPSSSGLQYENIVFGDDHYSARWSTKDRGGKGQRDMSTNMGLCNCYFEKASDDQLVNNANTKPRCVTLPTGTWFTYAVIG